MNQKSASRSGRLPVILVVVVAVPWVVHLVNVATGYALNEWGIRPRSLQGLVGLLSAPFLHGSWHHLLMNSWPLAILGGLVLLKGLDTLVELSLFVAIVGGLGVWIFGGSNEVHVGASGLIFGYFGFLVARGVFLKELIPLTMSILVLGLYGTSFFFGLLPTARGISWEGHLFGLLAGVLAAWMEWSNARRHEQKESEGESGLS